MAPLTQEKSDVDGAISILEIYGLLAIQLKYAPKIESVGEEISSLGLGWANSGGESTAIGSTKTLAVDGVFIAIGQEPQNQPFRKVCELDANGYIVAGQDCRTQTPGVFAAGDCRAKELRQLVTATADGACASLAACRYVEEHFR